VPVACRLRTTLWVAHISDSVGLWISMIEKSRIMNFGYRIKIDE